MTDARAVTLLASRGQDHWWHAGMRDITRSMLDVHTAGRALDIGCGPGLDICELPPELTVVGIDLQESTVVPERFVIANGARPPFGDSTFDVVLLLDVLDNPAADPERILCEVHRLLRPGGRLFVRVPAYPWLRGARDVFWGTARRYYRRELASLVLGAELTVCRLSYANCLLFPPAAVLRLAGRLMGHGREDLDRPPLGLNSLLRRVLSTEAQWLRAHDLPFGLSLVCVATRMKS